MNSLPDKQNPAPAFFSPRKLWHPLPWALSLLQQQPAVFLFPGDKHSSGKGAELPVKWVKRGTKHPPQDAPRQGFSRPPQPPRFPYKIRKQKRAAITAHSCTDGHNKEGFSQQGLWLGWMWGRVFSNSWKIKAVVSQAKAFQPNRSCNYQCKQDTHLLQFSTFSFKCIIWKTAYRFIEIKKQTN